MHHTVIPCGISRSFPDPDHPLLKSATEDGEVLLLIGDQAGQTLKTIQNLDQKKAVLLELGTECLGLYTGEHRGEEGSNILGFARFRLGEGEPSDLVELVRQPKTPAEVVKVGQEFFERFGLEVAVCLDFAGRIIDRLVRPYFNDALRRLDEQLATAEDLDKTLQMGLGYPEGPISLLTRTGLHHHYDVTQELFETYGEKAYAPARRARIAKKRRMERDSSCTMDGTKGDP